MAARVIDMAARVSDMAARMSHCAALCPRVEKVVSGDSAEARLTSVSAAGPSLTGSRGRGRGGGGLKGLSSVLGQLGRKPKLGTLEKSKLDWENFKSKEGLQDEIHTFNKGKDGYLERQDFLQRTDLRQFELERDLRTTRRSNSALLLVSAAFTCSDQLLTYLVVGV
uniref:Craniofacial development protein 1 n=1 Tax=Timema shepardi TaxID=629360 RepID=A0A7R9B819_TIMSH|nr:unnamed protein product [Timema shepardi]